MRNLVLRRHNSYSIKIISLKGLAKKEKKLRKNVQLETIKKHKGTKKIAMSRGDLQTTFVYTEWSNFDGHNMPGNFTVK